MEIYLASNFTSGDIAKVIPRLENPDITEMYGIKTESINEMNILESYYYIRNLKNFNMIIKKFRNFMLDSGAFTFLSNTKTECDWDKYAEEYAMYIKKNNIKLFFELDIDSIIGLDSVEKLRAKIERITQKRCIPVWHPSRGYDYFVRICKEYDYVAIGGIVSREIPRSKYEEIFPKLIADAHRYNAKIHGLGYTSVKKLPIYHFDSVDSTSWLIGNRGGFVTKFNPKKCEFISISPPKWRRLDSRKTAVNNFNEWIKFQKYARIYI